jgi:CubicO group peptidase (beta-lactamase class C family)
MGMIRTALAATALLLAAPAIAQSQQEQLDARYDRALAAGYKALMLCSAIAHAEANGTTRTPESVMQWELTGIQAPLDRIVGELPFEIVRFDQGMINHVAVSYADDATRYALYYPKPGDGCVLEPLGFAPDGDRPEFRTVESSVDTAPEQRPDAKLAAMLSDRFAAALGQQYGEGARTTAVAVLYRGGLAERYRDGFDASTPQRTWSVAKSIAATLVGAAVHDGDASVDDPVGLNYWRSGGQADVRNTITIDHALRMATGRYSDTPGNRTDPLYWGGSTVDETATAWPVLHPPGTAFRYANNDTLIAVKAIQQWVDFYPPAGLFAKLGMDHTVAETDWQGNYILSSQVWTTARDLASFGQLYLNGGKLEDGTRVLPEDWLTYVSTPSGPQPTSGTFGYGAGFWLLNKEEGVPSDTISANGNRGQYVVIVPSRDLVIVRRGEDPAGAGFDIAGFTRDVLAALPPE